MSKLVEKLTRTSEDKRFLQQERAIIATTELICQLMEQEGVTKADLARRLGTSKANITQMLDGRRNMTIRTVSDVLYHLDRSLAVRATEQDFSWTIFPVTVWNASSNQVTRWQDVANENAVPFQLAGKHLGASENISKIAS